MNSNTMVLEVKSKEVDTEHAVSLESLVYQGGLEGPLAKFFLQQCFCNMTEKPLEIVYTFPISSDMLISGFRLRINGKDIISEVRPLEEVMERYDQAILKGDSAVYLQQQRSNIFTMNIGNLAPGEECWLRIDLLQLLKLQNGCLRLILPTVVGPRYIPGAPIDKPSDGIGWSIPTDQVPDADWITPPVSPEGVPYRVAFKISVPDTMPIQEVESPSHPLRIVRNKGEMVIESASSPRANRDIILNLRFKENIQQKVWLCHTESATLGLAWLKTTGTQKRQEQPADYLFLLDTSGSMAYEKLKALKRTVSLCLRKLSSGDRINFVAFDHRYRAWRNDWSTASGESLQVAENWVHSLEADGGTELLPALKFAMDLPYDSERKRVLILLTDGQVGNESAIANLFKSNRNRWIALLFGIDSAVNQELFNRILQNTTGSVEYIYPGESMEEKVNYQFERLRFPFVKKITSADNRIKVRKVIPDTNLILHSDDLYPLLMQLDMGFNPEILPLKLGLQDGNEVEIPLQRLEASDNLKMGITRFWAHLRIKQYEQEWGTAGFRTGTRAEKRLKKAIVRLALEHQLQSKFTSWIAVMEREEKLQEQPQVQVVPVELPDSWEYENIFCQHYNAVYCREHFQPEKCLSLTDRAMLDDIGKYNALDVSSYHEEEREQSPGPVSLLTEIFLSQEFNGALIPSALSYLPEWHATLVTLLAVAIYIQKNAADWIPYCTNLEKALNFLEPRSKNFKSEHWAILVAVQKVFQEVNVSLNLPESLIEGIEQYKDRVPDKKLKTLMNVSVDSITEDEGWDSFYNAIAGINLHPV